jgi:hypothetical protein
MIAYKFLTRNLRSKDEFQWELGVKQTIEKEGNRMCSSQVFHCYNHVLLAELACYLHVPRYFSKLFAIETSQFVNSDGIKFASKSQTILREIERPFLSIEQRGEFAIRLALCYVDDIEWKAWAKNWLDPDKREQHDPWEMCGKLYYDSQDIMEARQKSAMRNATAAAADKNQSDQSYFEYASYAAYAIEDIQKIVVASENSRIGLVDSLVIFNQNMIEIIEDIVNRKPDSSKEANS